MMGIHEKGVIAETTASPRGELEGPPPPTALPETGDRSELRTSILYTYYGAAVRNERGKYGK